MKAVELPSATLLRELLAYDPETGCLTWKRRSAAHYQHVTERAPSHCAAVFNSRFEGRPAFTNILKNGYHTGAILGRHYYAHRVIWKIVHGTDPLDIDHVNGIRTDNRLCNLESKPRGENLKNRRLSRNNTSGFHGVWLDRRRGRWVARIESNGQQINLGRFKEKADAVAARKAAEAKLGFHENHGRG